MRPPDWTPLRKIKPCLKELVQYLRDIPPDSVPASAEGFIPEYLRSRHHLESAHLWSDHGPLMANMSRVWADQDGYHAEEEDIELPDELDTYFVYELVDGVPTAAHALRSALKIQGQ
jgi:hypothetical protein